MLADAEVLPVLDIKCLRAEDIIGLKIQSYSVNPKREFKEKAERAFILKQLNENSWNISKTAELLDIQRSHLYNKMKKYNL